MSQPSATTGGTKSRRFADFLRELEEGEDRAALAALRRGLGKRPGEAPEMFPYLVPWMPSEASPWQEAPYYLVASLFGLHPLSWGSADVVGPTTNLGASLAILGHKERVERAGVERRFVALLNSDRDDLPEHLRRIVGLLKAHEVPVDWARLLDDLGHWDWMNRPVQRRWARAFWGSQQPDLGSGSTAEAGEEGEVEVV